MQKRGRRRPGQTITSICESLLKTFERGNQGPDVERKKEFGWRAEKVLGLLDRIEVVRAGCLKCAPTFSGGGGASNEIFLESLSSKEVPREGKKKRFNSKIPMGGNFHMLNSSKRRWARFEKPERKLKGLLNHGST